MAYACPVCEAVEADGIHLANHLAVTAMLHGEDHAAWLDAHVPDWADRDPASLGADVVDHAEETDDELTVDRAGAGGRRGPAAIPPDQLDEAARRILEDARALTRERRGDPEE